MLTDDQKYDNKKTYLTLMSKLSFDMTDLVEYLDTIDYFEKPASTQYQRAYAGGLCEQALKFCHELGVLCNAYYPGRYTEEDIIKVALFKDIYKAELYEYYAKNIKNDLTGQWETIGAYRNKENRPTYGDIGFSSYMIAKRFTTFTDEQIEAIVQTNGLNNFSPDIHDILKKYPLALLAKMAEMVINYIIA